MCGNETPGRIVTNFCTDVGVHDVITSANFYYCRLWGLSVVGVKCWVSPLTRVVALTTLSHYVPCECVIIIIINVKNAVYRHVNGKIAQLKQQISELGF